ncbi:hypothetical protein [Rhodococcus sp. JVH1]|uniref:hypothetical protein n=1 Tax=Rhodococcus sp. JVH1 TaxID=745408 RepID=UPI0002720D18|nr:hypothetical protein [Rhodococcus sp. JVH1]EJJ01043.1 hypothetical protein JVH1_1669 [Rhodococcus sp. JVH1]
MSTYADPKKAVTYLDGDGFRAPAGTAFPGAAIFASPVVTPAVTGPPSIPAVTWDPFGGIQKGLDLNPTRELKEHEVFNYRDSAYDVTTGPLKERLKFRAVDRSKATTLTRLEGGSVVEIEADEVYEFIRGAGEDFAFIWRAMDFRHKTALYCERVRLVTPPPRSFSGQDLDGWEFELLALAKVREFGTDDGGVTV